MTQEEKRIKLAEYAFNQTQGQEWAVVKPLPDYFSDLNAVHELEKTVFNTPEPWRYFHFLNEVVCGEDLVVSDVATGLMATATAAQRAEALGLTLNLWNE